MTSSRRARLSASELGALVLLALFAANGARAESSSLVEAVGPSGSLRASAWQRDKRFGPDGGFGVGSAWLTLRPKEAYGVRGFFEGFVQGEDLSRRADSFGEVREAYLESSAGPLDFKVGRFISVWGRADKANPTDSLSVRNFRMLATDDEDQRLGVVSIQSVYNVGDARLTAIWLPEWRSPTYPIPAIPGIALKDEAPANPLSQFALKFDRVGGAVDWSVSFADAYNRTPDLRVLSAGAAGTSLAFAYHRQQVFGADFATSVGGFGVRGEVAYARQAEFEASDYGRQRSSWYAVLGGDRDVVERFNLNAQVLYRKVEGFQDASSIANPAFRSLAAQTAINANQLAADQLGATFRPSCKLLHETLELEAATIAWFAKGDGLVRPKASYAINDRWRAAIGGEFYFGPDDSFFGRLKPASTAFAEARWLF